MVVAVRKKHQGTPGFEPGTSRSAVECSTTELYPPTGVYKKSNNKHFKQTLLKGKEIAPAPGIEPGPPG